MSDPEAELAKIIENALAKMSLEDAERAVSDILSIPVVRQQVQEEVEDALDVAQTLRLYEGTQTTGSAGQFFNIVVR